MDLLLASFPSNRAVPNDVLVLTKPLGIGIAMKMEEWLSDPEKAERMGLLITEKEMRTSIKFARKLSNVLLNDNAVQELKNYDEVHAVTIIGKHGILGHAEIMAKNQQKELDFVICNMPLVDRMDVVGRCFEYDEDCQLLKGRAPEVSGGLLVAMERFQATLFCREMKRKTGLQSWIVGIAEYGDGKAKISDHICLQSVLDAEEL